MNFEYNFLWFFFLHFQLDEVLPKIHTFQKSLEAVMQRLVEAERADLGAD